MSTRAPACAPPPKIWICGTGSATASFAGELSATAAPCAPRHRRARRRARPRRWHWRRAGACRACRRARSGAGRSPAGRRRSSRAAPSRMRVFTFWTACGRIERLAPRPSRSRRPPARSRGRWRARVVPRPTSTSASTVGRPRESQTRRPLRRRSLPCFRHFREPREPAACRAARARRVAPASFCRARSSGTRPATCRRRARGAAPAAASRRAPRSRPLQSDAFEVGVRQRVEALEEAGAAPAAPRRTSGEDG